MKTCFIKYEKEKNRLLPRILGMDIEKIQNPEDIDIKIDELKKNEYTTIMISSDLASFSEKISNKYKWDYNMNVVIIP